MYFSIAFKLETASNPNVGKIHVPWYIKVEIDPRTHPKEWNNGRWTQALGFWWKQTYKLQYFFKEHFTLYDALNIYKKYAYLMMQYKPVMKL